MSKVKKEKQVKEKPMNVYLSSETIKQLSNIKKFYGINKKIAIKVAIDEYYNKLTIK